MILKVSLFDLPFLNCKHPFAGGYTTGPKELIDLLRNRSRPYLFSNSLPPPVVGTASKVFDLLMESSERTEKLVTNTHRFRNRMTEAGFTVLVCATIRFVFLCGYLSYFFRYIKFLPNVLFYFDFSIYPWSRQLLPINVIKLNFLFGSLICYWSYLFI